jgi:hypothetical protein
MIDYSTTLAALDAALASAPSPEKEIGQDLRKRLASLGSELTVRFTTPVGNAKTAWAAAASAAFIEAAEAAGYIYSVKGEPAPPALVFHLYDPSELRQRLSDAAVLLERTDTFLARVISVHRSAWSAVWAAGGGLDGDAYFSLSKSPTNPHGERQSPAALERAIHTLISGDAAQWLALVAF